MTVTEKKMYYNELADQFKWLKRNYQQLKNNQSNVAEDKNRQGMIQSNRRCYPRAKALFEIADILGYKGAYYNCIATNYKLSRFHVYS